MKIEAIQTNTRVKHVFTDVPQIFINFVPGCKVLSSEMEAMGDSTPTYFIKKHEPGEKGWKDGGFECNSITGSTRCFHLDSLVVHPDEFNKRTRAQFTLVKDGETPLELPTEINIENTVERTSKRGRKRTKPVIVKDPNAPKGQRGRKPLSPEEKQRRIDLGLIVVKDPNAPKGKRGRPKMDPSLLKPKVEYVPKGNGKRGRPSIPEHLRKTKPYVPKGYGKRGRPSKASQDLLKKIGTL